MIAFQKNDPQCCITSIFTRVIIFKLYNLLNLKNVEFNNYKKYVNKLHGFKNLLLI